MREGSLKCQARKSLLGLFWRLPQTAWCELVYPGKWSFFFGRGEHTCFAAHSPLCAIAHGLVEWVGLRAQAGAGEGTALSIHGQGLSPSPEE